MHWCIGVSSTVQMVHSAKNISLFFPIPWKRLCFRASKRDKLESAWFNPILHSCSSWGSFHWNFPTVVSFWRSLTVHKVKFISLLLRQCTPFYATFSLWISDLDTTSFWAWFVFQTYHKKLLSIVESLLICRVHSTTWFNLNQFYCSIFQLWPIVITPDQVFDTVDCVKALRFLILVSAMNVMVLHYCDSKKKGHQRRIEVNWGFS